MDNYNYIGWIPCVNGHLDFGLMRAGISGGFSSTSKSKDKNNIQVNFSKSSFSDSHQRRIVLQSKVDWRDSEKYDEDSGKFRVIVTAEVESSQFMDERFLIGNMLIYPIISEPVDKASRCSMKVHKLCHDINDSTENRNSLFNDLQGVTSGVEKLDGLAHYTFYSSLKFKIEANGVVYIGYNDNSPEVDDETKYIIARQAYYYLKYSIHTHKHHESKRDSLTTITPLYGNSNDEKNEAGLRLICQLKRELTVIKRGRKSDGKEHPTDNAVGIIAYVKSLILSLWDLKIISNDVKVRELNRFSYMKESFEAQTNWLENTFSNLELAKSKSKVLIGFSLVSVWGVLNLLFKGAVNEKIDISVPYIISGFFVLIVGVVFSYYMILHFYKSKHSPDKTEQLYKSGYWKLGLKAAIPLLVSAILHYMTTSKWSAEQFGSWIIELMKGVYRFYYIEIS